MVNCLILHPLYIYIILLLYYYYFYYYYIYIYHIILYIILYIYYIILYYIILYYIIYILYYIILYNIILYYIILYYIVYYIILYYIILYSVLYYILYIILYIHILHIYIYIRTKHSRPLWPLCNMEMGRTYNKNHLRWDQNLKMTTSSVVPMIHLNLWAQKIGSQTSTTSSSLKKTRVPESRPVAMCIAKPMVSYQKPPSVHDVGSFMDSWTTPWKWASVPQNRLVIFPIQVLVF